MSLVEKLAERPKTLRILGLPHADIYDDLANLIFEALFAASSVSSPVWTAWSVQHNALWGDLFGFQHRATDKIIALKVRRLLYNEIRRMDRFVNFKGACILGYCLHVLGLKLADRHGGLGKEFYPLHAAVLAWTKANYRKLVADHPNVAAACLQGSISYDSDNRRLVETYENAIGKEPTRRFLEVE